MQEKIGVCWKCNTLYFGENDLNVELCPECYTKLIKGFEEAEKERSAANDLQD